MIKFITLISLVLAACAEIQAPNKEEYLTPKDIQTNSERYDGKEVLVKGFFVYGTNSRSLFQSEELYWQLREESKNNPDFDPEKFEMDCLTLLNANILIENYGYFLEKTNIFKGIVKANYMDGTIIDLQACGVPALILDEGYLKELLEALKNENK